MGQIIQQPIDFAFRSDVDAAGRLVEEENLCLRREPLGDNQLLLRAARQVSRLLSQRRRLDRQVLDLGNRGRSSHAGPHHSEESNEAAECRQHNVGLHVERQRQAVALAIF